MSTTSPMPGVNGELTVRTEPFRTRPAPTSREAEPPAGAPPGSIAVEPEPPGGAPAGHPAPRRRRAGPAAAWWAVAAAELLVVGVWLLREWRTPPCDASPCLPGVWNAYPWLMLGMLLAGFAGVVGTGIATQGTTRFSGRQVAVLLGSGVLFVAGATGARPALVLLALGTLAAFNALRVQLIASERREPAPARR